MFPIHYTALAGSDLQEIVAQLESNSPRAAERFASDYDKKLLLLSQFPSLGRLSEYLYTTLRSVVIQKYIVYYRVHDYAIEIIRILHGKRDARAILTGED